MLWERPDVLVIGGGASAAVAALEASKKCRVMMISKDRVLGGASIQAVGGISIPGFAGEDPKLFVEDTVRSGQGINDLKLVKVLANEGTSLIKFLEGLGVVLDQDHSGKYRVLKKAEGHSGLRNYNDRRMFHEIGRVLRANISQSSNITLLEHAMVFGMCAEEGRIIGAAAYSMAEGKLVFIAPKSVVLASGGYGRVYGVSDNSTSLTGEGHSMALQCGAELMDMEMVQFMPLAFPFPNGMVGIYMGMCSSFGPQVKLLNGLGKRFMSAYAPEKLEYGTRDQVARGIFQEIQAGRGTKNGTVIVDPTGNDPALLAQYKASIPTVYSQIERAFGEKAARWEEPFEAIPTQHFCMGGVRIDSQARTACTNLFATGEVTAGVHGANRLAGNALLEAVTFGRIAGQSAGDEADKRIVPAERKLEEYFKAKQSEIYALVSEQGGDTNRPSGYHFKSKIGKLMWEFGGIVRNGNRLNEGIKRLEELTLQLAELEVKEQSKWNYSLVEALEAKHMVKVCEAILKSALLRTESRGSHFREDFPASDPAYLANILVSQDQNQQLKFELKPVGEP